MLTSTFNERSPSLERSGMPAYDELSLLIARARNRVEWRIAHVKAQRAPFDALNELADELGVVPPARFPVPSTMAEARDAVASVLALLERMQLSPESRVRIGVHLIPLRSFAHGQSVGASADRREAT